MTNEIPYSNDSLAGGPGNALVPYSSTVAMTAQSAELVALGGAWGTSLDGLVWESAYDAKGTTPEWRQAFFTLLALHPDVRVRRHLAVTGPLGTLRRLVHDPNPAVRYAAACNPRVVDVEVQRALAGDSDVRVVLQLLARVTPDREAALIVANGQHPEAAAAIAAGRTPAEEAERRRVADRDRWILNGMAEQSGLPELLGCVA